MTERSPGIVTLRGAFINAGLAVLLAVGVNGLVQVATGIEDSGTRGGDAVGPVAGWLIGAVWIVLFAGLGLVRGVMQATGSEAALRASRAVVFLLFCCALYPLYTFGLHSDAIGLVGNVATSVLATWVAGRVVRVNRAAVLAPLAVVAWLAFASFALLDQR